MPKTKTLPGLPAADAAEHGMQTRSKTEGKVAHIAEDDVHHDDNDDHDDNINAQGDGGDDDGSDDGANEEGGYDDDDADDDDDDDQPDLTPVYASVRANAFRYFDQTIPTALPLTACCINSDSFVAGACNTCLHNWTDNGGYVSDSDDDTNDLYDTYMSSQNEMLDRVRNGLKPIAKMCVVKPWNAYNLRGLTILCEQNNHIYTTAMPDLDLATLADLDLIHGLFPQLPFDVRLFRGISIREAFNNKRYWDENFVRDPGLWFLTGLLYGYPLYTTINLWLNQGDFPWCSVVRQGQQDN